MTCGERKTLATVNLARFGSRDYGNIDDDTNTQLIFWSILSIFSGSILIFFSFQGTREEWLVVFDIASIIFVFGCVVYIFFGSSELEPWAKVQKETNEEFKSLTKA